MKIAKKDIEAIIWLLREIIALFLKLKKKNKDEKDTGHKTLAGTAEP